MVGAHKRVLYLLAHTRIFDAAHDPPADGPSQCALVARNANATRRGSWHYCGALDRGHTYSIVHTMALHAGRFNIGCGFPAG